MVEKGSIKLNRYRVYMGLLKGEDFHHGQISIPLILDKSRLARFLAQRLVGFLLKDWLGFLLKDWLV